jgi:hypothetical protein
MAPLSLPVAAARGAIDFRTKVFASLAALGLVLVGGVAVLAVTRLPPPAPAVAVQPVAAAQPLAAAPSIAAAQPVAAVVQRAAAAPAAVADNSDAVVNKEPDSAAVAPKRVATKPKATTDDAEHASKTQRRAGKTVSAAHDAERVTKATADKEKPSSGKASSSAADIDDLILAKTPAPAKEKASAPTPKKSGSASIDDLLDEAVSAKKPAPKSEAAEPKGDLPATPSRDEIAAAYAKAKAKVQSCKGSGVATAMISIKGSSGRASTVSVTGVEGAAKSCVETAVRSTSFPKFQKDKFDVKLPFKLGA